MTAHDTSPPHDQTILITGATDGLGRALAERLAGRDRLDVLVNNAGIGVETTPRRSVDGLELTFQVDYLATYMLSRLLTPLLVRTAAMRATTADPAPARIVNVSSAGQSPLDFNDVLLERHWDGVQAYCQAKLAQIMLTLEHAERLRDHGVTHTARLVTDPALAEVTGAYFNRSRPARAHDQAYDTAARTRLLEISRRLTGVSLPAAPLHAA